MIHVCRFDSYLYLIGGVVLGIFPELLLSLVVLILVVYGLRGGVLKASIVMLILVVLISFWLRLELVFLVNSVVNGLLLTNG